MKVTLGFGEQINKVWGKPIQVADVAINELFRHGGEIGLDFDDQVEYAKKIGVLAGELKDSDPENFVQRFEKEILNEE